jgi:hypothetical protein
MTVIADSSPAVLPQLAAGLLLAAGELQRKLGLPHSTAEEIVKKTAASRSSAYEVRSRLLEVLPSLVRPVGRPSAPAVTLPPETYVISREVIRFVMAHPGCVHGSAGRREYSDSFRRFILELHHRRAELGLDLLAEASCVPIDTLRDWLRVKPLPAPAPATPPATSATSGRVGADPLHLETVLAAWSTWEGDFSPFCEHVRHHLRVPFGRTVISAILETHCVRRARRRAGRSPDETALRKSFETFFPGAQWVGDGTPVAVTFLGQRFTFNFELLVDAYSAAFTGVSIRDEEDAAALTEAIDDGKLTTGAPPLAVLVDNRPSNWAPSVVKALDGESLLIPATVSRPQNKGHVEGAFGLFFQVLPTLVISAASNREIAREILRLVVTIWGRTLNGRPRAARGGRSRIELYAEKPTPEQLARARASLEERLRRQLAARLTEQARLNPVVRQVLAAAFSRLALSDPEGKLQGAIARYPLSPVIDGIAIFEGKRAADSLPPGVDGRYLLGIVRNLAQQRESELISEAMLRARLAAQDAILAPLVERHRRALAAEPADAPGLLQDFVAHALESDRYLDRLFWLSAAGALLRQAHGPEREGLYRLGVRLINAASRLPYVERLDAVRFLAGKAFPLD